LTADSRANQSQTIEDDLRREETPSPERKGKGPRLEAVIETPQYDLTVFKLHFGVPESAIEVRTAASGVRSQETPRQRPDPEKRQVHAGHYMPPVGLRAMALLVILRQKVLNPVLAGVGKPKMGRKPKNWTRIDEHYGTIRQNTFVLFQDLGIAALENDNILSMLIL
jgi:hypothetical protein